MDIYSEFPRIMENELRLNPKDLGQELRKGLTNAEYFKAVTERILEVAKNGTILRVGMNMGRLTDNEIAYASVSAHVNICKTIFDYLADFAYGYESTQIGIYSRREFAELFTLHDLIENVTKDEPDNGNGYEKLKNATEKKYIEDILAKKYPPLSPWRKEETQIFIGYVKTLSEEMREKKTHGGRIGFAVDKLSAVIEMLGYDSIAYGEIARPLIPHCPYALPSDKGISDLNREQMKICDRIYDEGFLLSELWTIDFLHKRNIAQYDDTGFCTAVIVMATLLVHDKWFDWREKQYLLDVN